VASVSLRDYGVALWIVVLVQPRVWLVKPKQEWQSFPQQLQTRTDADLPPWLWSFFLCLLSPWAEHWANISYTYWSILFSIIRIKKVLCKITCVESCTAHGLYKSIDIAQAGANRLWIVITIVMTQCFFLFSCYVLKIRDGEHFLCDLLSYRNVYDSLGNSKLEKKL